MDRVPLHGVELDALRWRKAGVIRSPERYRAETEGLGTPPSPAFQESVQMKAYWGPQ
jgi:hypothetical protein